MTSRLYIAAAILFMSSALLTRAGRFERPPARESFSAFPRAVGEWTMYRSEPFTPEVLKVLAVDDYMNRVYLADPHRAVSIYAGYYASQQQGDTIHSPLNCLPGSGWEVAEKSRVVLDMGAGRSEQVNEFLIEKGIERQVVLYWYQSHGRVVASEYWGKAFLVWDAIRMNRSDGSMVRVIAPAGTGDTADEMSARAAVREFSRQIFALLSPYIPD